MSNPVEDPRAWLSVAVLLVIGAVVLGVLYYYLGIWVPIMLGCIGAIVAGVYAWLYLWDNYINN